LRNWCFPGEKEKGHRGVRGVLRRGGIGWKGVAEKKIRGVRIRLAEKRNDAGLQRPGWEGKRMRREARSRLAGEAGVYRVVKHPGFHRELWCLLLARLQGRD